MNSIRISTCGFKYKSNGVPILSKEDIDSYAEAVISDFKPELLTIPQPTPVEEFVEIYLGLNVDYHKLSLDNSILGMIAFNEGYVEVYDENSRKKFIEAAEGTAFIDTFLLEEDQKGRFRFTFGHEPGHWIFHKRRYYIPRGQMSFLDELSKPVYVKCHKKNVGVISRKSGGFNGDDEWMEWHADYFSSALLMPKAAFRLAVDENMHKMNLANGYFKKVPPTAGFMNARMIVSNISRLFEVSYQAAAVRLFKTGYIENELLALVLSV